MCVCVLKVGVCVLQVRRALVFNWYAAMQIRFSKVLTTVQLHHHEPARIPQSPPVSARMEVKSEVYTPQTIKNSYAFAP